MAGALLRYRIMAYIVGVLLLLLVFVAMPMRYIWHQETPIAMVHGYMYMIYLVTVVDLTIRAKWSIFPRALMIALAGTIPFFSFYAEHKATGWAKQQMAAAEQAKPPAEQQSPA